MVDNPWTAYAQADVINEYALEESDGLTYAQLDQDDPRRDTVMTASFLRASLFTSVVSFDVAAFAFGPPDAHHRLGAVTHRPVVAGRVDPTRPSFGWWVQLLEQRDVKADGDEVGGRSARVGDLERHPEPRCDVAADLHVVDHPVGGVGELERRPPCLQDDDPLVSAALERSLLGQTETLAVERQGLVEVVASTTSRSCRTGFEEGVMAASTGSADPFVRYKLRACPCTR
jgi:hypothetical protein